MQVSDLLGQYNQATQPSKVIRGTTVKQLVSSLKEMSPGNVFEGTVTSMKNGQITLSLSNGQSVVARLEGKVSLLLGQSMFFQVKSNDGSQIAIRPYTIGGNSANLTLLHALNAAGIPADGRNLSMVNVMMEEHMPIDRNSLAQMARIVQGNPELDVKTLVQMQKLNLPVSPEMVSQFQNYAEDKQAINRAMDDFMKELGKSMADEKMTGGQIQKMGKEILSLITEGLSERVQASEHMQLPEHMRLPEHMQLSEHMQSSGAQISQGEQTEFADTASLETENGMLAERETEQEPVQNTLGSILSKEEIVQLDNRLNAVLSRGLNGDRQEGIRLSASDSTVFVLNRLQEKLQNGGKLGKEVLVRLFSGKEFRALLNDAMEQQWLLKPKQLEEENTINRLYEKIKNQVGRLEDIVNASGQESESIQKLAADIRNNVEFMEQVNQAYTYVQIPLKMANQNASGELYVYTNKKNLKEDSKDLTAFLHLDMDHLGSTDVSVRMHKKEVFTKFYFEDDATYQLVEAHIGILNDRLKAKGYNSTVQVVNESKSVDFVEDFLKKDQPTAGTVHRYSFDMRA